MVTLPSVVRASSRAGAGVADPAVNAATLIAASTARREVLAALGPVGLDGAIALSDIHWAATTSFGSLISPRSLNAFKALSAPLRALAGLAPVTRRPTVME